MYLWLVERAKTDNVDYDQFRKYVACAATSEEALYVIPRDVGADIGDILEVGLPTTVEEYLEYELKAGEFKRPRAHWVCTLIGIPMSGAEPGIVVKDFLRG